MAYRFHNRTHASLIPCYYNKVVAEAPWLVGVVPSGTHEWSKFVNADELKGLMRAQNEASRRSRSKALDGMRWKCVFYVLGVGVDHDSRLFIISSSCIGYVYRYIQKYILYTFLNRPWSG